MKLFRFCRIFVVLTGLMLGLVVNVPAANATTTRMVSKPVISIKTVKAPPETIKVAGKSIKFQLYVQHRRDNSRHDTMLIGADVTTAQLRGAHISNVVVRQVRDKWRRDSVYKDATTRRRSPISVNIRTPWHVVLILNCTNKFRMAFDVEPPGGRAQRVATKWVRLKSC